jgi:CelD/BcsL family acetyltransferase involved in cellulose biosynthesis
LPDQYAVSQISLADYADLWSKTRKDLSWKCPFVAPLWIQSVVTHLGIIGEPLILTIARNGQLVGIAPFSFRDGCVYFLGIPDVCDYQDMIVAPGHEETVGPPLVDFLCRQGIRRLDLRTLRPDAVTVRALHSIENQPQLNVQWVPDDVTFETLLPADWEGYLLQLNGKQRHEVRRKMRRLDAHGRYQFELVEGSGGLDDATFRFFKLFQLNRTDKAEFMDDTMSGFFRNLIGELAQHGMLRLYFLYVEEQPAATVLCFDYNGTRYLYNSGYDAHYRDLSVGILSKILSIKKGIESGCRTYDFLKGAEGYKKRIGGQEVALQRCLVEL